jgi:hypothetical protein
MLTKDDIKSIRQADYIVMFYSPNKEQGAEWGIRVGKRTRGDKSVWDNEPYDVTRTIEANTERCAVVSYDRPVGEVKSCVAVTNLYDFEVFPACVFKQFRVGDEVGLRFMGGNNNGYMKDCGLYHDEVRIRIVRGDKVVAEYPIEDSVCKNNSARIVRYVDSL